MTTRKIAYSFVATVSLLPTDKGGRRSVVYNHYRPSFTFNTIQHFSGEIDLINKQELHPGEFSTISVKLLPARHLRKNLKPGDAFAITEGTKIVGTGFIKEITKQEFVEL